MFAVVARAELLNPVQWQSRVIQKSDTEGVLEFKAKIASGFHMYSMGDFGADGPVALSLHIDKQEGVRLTGTLKASAKPHRQHDEQFGMELSWFTGSVVFTQTFAITSSRYHISGNLEYMACTETTCTAPAEEPFDFSGTANAAAAPAAEADTSTTAMVAEDTVEVTTAADDLWKPVEVNNIAGGDADDGGDTSSLWFVIITCFIGGLVALLTPCVWPMIPLTVSFFLKKSGENAHPVRDAFIYGLSIIVIYVALGLVITIAFGASALNALATSAVCNIIFFLLLVVFAVSFFGAFEIKFPDSWGNKMDSAAEKTTGLISIFFMAFTLALVSFSCTGPIIGTLLVEAASQGSYLGPALGMFSFSLALAIPFCLFAMFPKMMGGLPKSGSWMNTVKVVLGFIELALSLKFLSVADLAYGWHILDRETFVALWISMFALLALYLLGKFSFSHYGSSAKNGIGVFRFLLAMVSIAFVAYLLPGLWGAPLKGVSAFVPPLTTQDFNLYGGEGQIYKDYDEGMAAADKAGQPVLVDFSGYGCVNCRKMEAAVIDNENVKAMIHENFTMIQLMVDEKAELPAPVTVEENGKRVKLVTVGDKWSYLQRYKFCANAQPYYVVLDGKGNLLAGPFTYEENVEGFMAFLRKGINNFKQTVK